MMNFKEALIPGTIAAFCCIALSTINQKWGSKLVDFKEAVFIVFLASSVAWPSYWVCNYLHIYYQEFTYKDIVLGYYLSVFIVLGIKYFFTEKRIKRL